MSIGFLCYIVYMKLVYFCSDVSDGSMKSLNGDQAAARHNRVSFLEKNGIDPTETTLHTLSYGGENYCRYVTLDDKAKGDGILRDSTIDTDAVVVAKPNHAILLPLADCIAAVIHDPTKNILMMSHLGRHNLEQFSGTRCIEYLVKEYEVNPTDLAVWLSPAADKENYPLYAFENRSLHDVATEQLITAGVAKENITASPIDSSTNPDYFSHSQFLKGNQDTDGRFAVVAVLSPAR
jgi:copper oxidase (laccase) domain-containing protein